MEERADTDAGGVDTAQTREDMLHWKKRAEIAGGCPQRLCGVPPDACHEDCTLQRPGQQMQNRAIGIRDNPGEGNVHNVDDTDAYRQTYTLPYLTHTLLARCASSRTPHLQIYTRKQCHS